MLTGVRRGDQAALASMEINQVWGGAGAAKPTDCQVERKDVNSQHSKSKWLTVSGNIVLEPMHVFYDYFGTNL